jgi:hypothetical protein
MEQTVRRILPGHQGFDGMSATWGSTAIRQGRPAIVDMMYSTHPFRRSRGPCS